LEAVIGIGYGLTRQYRRFRRFNDVALNVGIMLFERGGTPSKGAACAYEITKYVNVPLRLP
jgi:hypothetical protein